MIAASQPLPHVSTILGRMKKFFGYLLQTLAVIWSLQLLLRVATLLGLLPAPMGSSMAIVMLQLLLYMILVPLTWMAGRRLVGAAKAKDSAAP